MFSPNTPDDDDMDTRIVIRTRHGNAFERLFGQSRTMRIAILFAYWLFMAGAGLFAGASLIASLLISLIVLACAVGAWVLHETVKFRLENDDLASRMILAITGGMAAIVVGTVLLVPLVIYGALLLHLLASIPLWLYRL